jgi:hypothetical protein
MPPTNKSQPKKKPAKAKTSMKLPQAAQTQSLNFTRQKGQCNGSGAPKKLTTKDTGGANEPPTKTGSDNQETEEKITMVMVFKLNA